MLVLERPRRRRRPAAARPYAVLAGAGITSDAYDIVQPDKAGQVRALELAVAALGPVVRRHRARQRARHVDARSATWARPARSPSCSARTPSSPRTKSMTGHLLGAAGAIESIATVLTVHHGVVPPTINLDDPDDDLHVDVPREAREMSVDAAINDSFGFGGHNAVRRVPKGLTSCRHSRASGSGGTLVRAVPARHRSAR